MLALPLFVFTPITYSATNVTGHHLVIDPGHGGSDPGSTACVGLLESDANLDIARRLRGLLVADGATVYLTRDGDISLSNNDRYSLANLTDGEVLVSVHLNGSTDPNVNGTLGLYGKKSKDFSFTNVLHRRLASELSVPDLGITNFASGVLLKTNMPATISESVFISNVVECAVLRNGGGARQQEIAQSLYNGLSDWFGESSGGGGSGNGHGGGKPQH